MIKKNTNFTSVFLLLVNPENGSSSWQVTHPSSSEKWLFQNFSSAFLMWVIPAYDISPVNKRQRRARGRMFVIIVALVRWKFQWSNAWDISTLLYVCKMFTTGVVHGMVDSYWFRTAALSDLCLGGIDRIRLEFDIGFTSPFYHINSLSNRDCYAGRTQDTQN